MGRNLIHEASMKTINLTQVKYALVDDADYDWLMRWKWQALKQPRATMEPHWVAIRGEGPRRAYRQLYMHRELARRWGWPNSPQLDHQDRNGLNNQRENLRPASQSQQLMNTAKRGRCRSSFKGVHWCKRTKSWRARITVLRTRLSLGYFHLEEAAARAYDVAAYIHFGEFARTNF